VQVEVAGVQHEVGAVGDRLEQPALASNRVGQRHIGTGQRMLAPVSL